MAALSWQRPSDITIDDLISSEGAPRMSALAEATQFLHVFLKNGPVTSIKVEKEAAARDIAAKTLERARRALGVRSKKNGKGWFLSLPDEE